MDDIARADRNRVRNAFKGIQMGDLLGVPTERMSHEEILAATDGRGIRHPADQIDQALRKIPDTRGLAQGATSDDWAQAAAVATGFCMAGGYHHELFALLLLRSFKESASGAGMTSKVAFWEMEKWYLLLKSRHPGDISEHMPEGLTKKEQRYWEAATPRGPNCHAGTTENGLGRGNGVAMRSHAFWIWHGLRHGRFQAPYLMMPEMMAHGWTTHADKQASIAAYALGTVGCLLFRGLAGPVRRDCLEEWDYASARIDTPQHAHNAEHYYRLIDPHLKPKLSAELMLVAAAAADDSHLEALIHAYAAKNSSDALATVPEALAIFLRYPDDPINALLTAANAGGDTDTVASMVGALVGANCPADRMFDDDWNRFLPLGGRLAEDLGDELYEVATGKRLPRGFDLDQLKRELGYL